MLKELYFRIRYPWLYNFLQNCFTVDNFYRHVTITAIHKDYYFDINSLLPITKQAHLNNMAFKTANQFSYFDVNQIQKEFIDLYVKINHHYMITFTHDKYDCLFILKVIFNTHLNIVLEDKLFVKSKIYDYIVMPVDQYFSPLVQQKLKLDELWIKTK